MTSLREHWTMEHPQYQTLATTIASVLDNGLRRQGLRCTVTARAKSLRSFVKKMLRKGYTAPAQMGDRAGVRVVCLFSEDRLVVEQFVKETFIASAWDRKHEALAPDRVGYLGVHCQLQLREGDLRDLECELQIHTIAEHAWREPLHGLIYNPPEGHVIPGEVLRIAYRLAALVEVYDGELSRARNAVLSLPRYKSAQLLRALDSHFYRLTGKEYDRELSFLVLEALAPLLHDEASEAVAARIEVFARSHSATLDRIFADYETSELEVNAFIFQPESILLFELLERDIYRLKSDWATTVLELSYLEPFAQAWGLSLE